MNNLKELKNILENIMAVDSNCQSKLSNFPKELKANNLAQNQIVQKLSLSLKELYATYVKGQTLSGTNLSEIATDLCENNQNKINELFKNHQVTPEIQKGFKESIEKLKTFNHTSFLAAVRETIKGKNSLLVNYVETFGSKQIGTSFYNFNWNIILFSLGVSLLALLVSVVWQYFMSTDRIDVSLLNYLSIWTVIASLIHLTFPFVINSTTSFGLTFGTLLSISWAPILSIIFVGIAYYFLRDSVFTSVRATTNRVISFFSRNNKSTSGRSRVFNILIGLLTLMGISGAVYFYINNSNAEEENEQNTNN